ncbi:hypothetical protein ACX1C1_00690 [Paenibacillus sp. strain BS8-2]
MKDHKALSSDKITFSLAKTDVFIQNKMDKLGTNSYEIGPKNEKGMLNNNMSLFPQEL